MFVKRGVKYLDHIISFDQNDAFGNAGYNGLVAAYNNLQPTLAAASASDPNAWAPLAPKPADPTLPYLPIKREQYTRNDVTTVAPAVGKVTAYLANLLKGNSDNHAVGILMTDTYAPGAAFIKGVRDWQYNGSASDPADKATRLNITFSNVSFVGPDAFARQLQMNTTNGTPPKPYSDSVFVTQVVPNYLTSLGDTAKLYRTQAAERKVNTSFTSFEGFINGLILVKGLRTIGGPVTPETTIKALEEMPDLNLGLSVGAKFAAASHNYLRGVWLTEVKPDATFRDAYLWSDKPESKNTVSIEVMPLDAAGS
jgi:branched-chain amino acid transport system substrate-binding protein